MFRDRWFVYGWKKGAGMLYNLALDRVHEMGVAPGRVPYIETKPLHKSHFVVQRNEDGSAIFQMEVVLNYELEKDLLLFGEGVKVISPAILVNNMSRRLLHASRLYK